MDLIALPAFADNYIWMIHDGVAAMVVDPGDAQVVQATLQKHRLQLQAILLTHHHADHTGGVAELRAATHCNVFGPAFEALPEPIQRLSGGDRVMAMNHDFLVIDVPGHTAGHIAYFCADFAGAPLLFCGDTLFSAGCGRLFEGTPEQMLASLDALAALPADTRVCCAHEYTLSNLRFARAVEPENAALRAHEAYCSALREHGIPTLPSSIGLELQINPFLRSREPLVRQAIVQQEKLRYDSNSNQSSLFAGDADYFAALREWKNNFR